MTDRLAPGTRVRCTAGVYSGLSGEVQDVPMSAKSHGSHYVWVKLDQTGAVPWTAKIEADRLVPEEAPDEKDQAQD